MARLTPADLAARLPVPRKRLSKKETQRLAKSFAKAAIRKVGPDTGGVTKEAGMRVISITAHYLASRRKRRKKSPG